MREALRMAPARPNIPSGLRAGLATTLPLLLFPWFPHHELAWSSLAGFNTVLVDKGGAYRTRALSMLAMALFGALAVLLGTSIAEEAWLSVPIVLVVVFVGGFMRVFGAEATTLGVASSIAFVLALARPAADFHASVLAASFFVLGTLWSALISLVLWPLRPFKPSAEAVAASLLELAKVADSFVGGKDDAPAQVARRALLGRTRELIELARAALGTSRRARPGPSSKGEKQIRILEAADQLFAALTALEDSLVLERPQDLPDLPRWIDTVAMRVGAELRRAAEAVASEKRLGARSMPRPSFASVVSDIGEQQRTEEYVPLLLARALERLETLLAIAGEDPSDAKNASYTRPRELSTHASWSSLARDQLTLDSAIFRHALRMAISTAIAVRAMHWLEVEHGYWATLTCLVIMQPHGSATWTKALQRVGGTVLGAGVAMGVANFVHEGPLLIACVFVFVALGMALLPINYGAHAVFLTPAFVLLAETQAGNLDLAVPRVINTLIGAFIALLGSRLLFPISERDQFRPLIASAIGKLRGLLAVAAMPMPRAQGALRQARTELGLALLNAEASYQRLLTESSILPDESEALLTLLLYTHRLSSGFIALALVGGSHVHAHLQQEKGELKVELAELEQAIRERSHPPARSRVSTAPLALEARGFSEREPNLAADALDGDERVDVLFEQLDVLRNAVLRWNELESESEVIAAF
ncbi:MAG: FUSC family protein [Polyangiales bacterium]